MRVHLPIAIAFALTQMGPVSDARGDILESPNACAVPADLAGPGADYAAGVDVHGQPVAAADLAGPRLQGELRVPAEWPSRTVNGVLLKFILGDFRVDLETGAVTTTGNLEDVTRTAPANCPVRAR